MPIRSIRVACALIERDGALFAARRGPGGPHAGLWELPGGKIEPRETPGACVRRELHEELGLEVEPGTVWPAVRRREPAFVITLYPVLCNLTGGRLILREHVETGWFVPAELAGLAWSPPDIPIVRKWMAGQIAGSTWGL